MKKKTIDVRIDHDLYLELVEIRERVGVPVMESIRRAIREYIEKHHAKGVQVQTLPN